MTFTSTENLLLSPRGLTFPLPDVALAPAALFLGAHILKCMQEASENIKTGKPSKTQPSPRTSTADKSTQTVTSFAQKTAREAKTSSKGQRRPDRKNVPADEAKKSARGSKSCDVRPTSRSSKQQQGVTRAPSAEKKFVKSGAVEPNRSKTPSFSISQPTKGETIKSRRGSTGDCQKRTPGSRADMEKAMWLKNPVYASDGESDGRRTDRSDMSPPWHDISVAEKVPNESECTKTMSTSAMINMMKAKKNNPIRVRTTPPKMESVPEASRSVNRRREPTSPMPIEAEPRELSAAEIAIRQTIEKKLGRPYAELDPTALKTISEKRMKELKEKYAGNRPTIDLADREIPTPFVSRNHPRSRDSTSSPLQTQLRKSCRGTVN